MNDTEQIMEEYKQYVEKNKQLETQEAIIKDNIKKSMIELGVSSIQEVQELKEKTEQEIAETIPKIKTYIEKVKEKQNILKEFII